MYYRDSCYSRRVGQLIRGVWWANCINEASQPELEFRLWSPWLIHIMNWWRARLIARWLPLHHLVYISFEPFDVIAIVTQSPHAQTYDDLPIVTLPTSICVSHHSACRKVWTEFLYKQVHTWRIEELHQLTVSEFFIHKPIEWSISEMEWGLYFPLMTVFVLLFHCDRTQQITSPANVFLSSVILLWGFSLSANIVGN